MMNMPNSVCWNITNQCNDNCLFCYRDNLSRDLSYTERKIIIDKIAQSGIRKLTFAGGEPLLLPQIKTLIKYAKDKGLIVSLTTNAILLKDTLRNYCLENLDWLTLSLDGTTNNMQRKMTRNSSHFDHILENLDFASHYEQRKCKLKINTLVSKVNKNDILELAELILNNSVDRWKLFQFVPLRGSAKKYNNKFFISDDDFQSIVNDVQDYLKGKDILLSISERANIENAYFVIFPNGDIKISTQLHDKILGNALFDDIGQIWKMGNYQRELHEKRTSFITNYILTE